MSAGEEMAKKLRARFAAAMAVPQTDMATRLVGEAPAPQAPMAFPSPPHATVAATMPPVPPYVPPQGAGNPTMPWRGLPSPPPGMPMGGPSGPPAPLGNAASLPTPPPMPPMAQIDPAAPIPAYNASTDDRMQRLKLLDALNSGSYYS